MDVFKAVIYCTFYNNVSPLASQMFFLLMIKNGNKIYKKILILSASYCHGECSLYNCKTVIPVFIIQFSTTLNFPNDFISL